VAAPVGRSRSRQQKDDKSKPRKQEARHRRHYRTEVGPADTPNTEQQDCEQHNIRRGVSTAQQSKGNRELPEEEVLLPERLRVALMKLTKEERMMFSTTAQAPRRRSL
jgi:hypothetical protein